MFDSINTRKSIINGVSVFAAVLVIPALLYGIWSLWTVIDTAQNASTDSISEPTRTISLSDSYGLEAPLPEDIFINGSYYFTKADPEVFDGEARGYRHDFTEDLTRLATKVETKEIASLTPESSLIITTVDGREVVAKYVHETDEVEVLTEAGENRLQNLTVSPEGDRYAYSYQSTETGTQDIATWESVVVDLTSGERLETFSEAINVQFTNDPNDFLVMKSDGVYFIAGKDKPVRVFDWPFILTSEDELMLVNGTRYATLIVKGSIRVLSFASDNTLKQLGVVSSNNYSYSSSKVNQSDSLYSVIAKNEATGESKIEVRYFENTEVLEEIVFQ